MQITLFWHSYDYFPYEKRFAEREIENIFSRVDNLQVYDDRVSFTIESTDRIESKIDRLTYFRECQIDNHTRLIPAQARLEAASDNGGLEISVDNEPRCPAISRQQTRYSAHGIHEYKGKFNPQVVRALGNIVGLEEGDWLLDPFCGSGTTLLEAAHNDWNAIGGEINPLAVTISNSKIYSLNTPISQLKRVHSKIANDLNSCFAGIDLNSRFSESEIDSISSYNWSGDIHGYEYLKDWFAESVLIQLWKILERIEQLESSETQSILKVILSDLLRDVSLQDSGDLRTRRADSSPENVPVIPKFIARLGEHVDSMTKAKEQIDDNSTYQRAVQADARNLSESILSRSCVPDSQLFDAAITSPPYATALPYVDTHRLSMMLFGYIEPGEFRETDRSLIGTRNITKTSQRRLYSQIESNQSDLPRDCIALCRDLKAAVDPENDGFRRQNKPALVYRYLRDMKSSLTEIRSVLRTSAPFAMIVGPNSTKLGGEDYTIDNPDLLAEIGSQVGYKLEQNMQLDTHQRFGMHNTSHSIDAEKLLVLRK